MRYKIDVMGFSGNIVDSIEVEAEDEDDAEEQADVLMGLPELSYYLIYEVES